MLPRLAALVVLGFVTVNLARADDPKTEDPKPMSPSTMAPAPGSNSPASSEMSGTKPATTAVWAGTVTKVNDKQLSIKYTYKVGGPTKNHPTARARTVTKTLTFEIDFVPPVKLVSGTSRTNGTYADVKAGDKATVGVGPHIIKTADGKSTTNTRVTGIDLVKHTGSTTTTPTSPSKN